MLKILVTAAALSAAISPTKNDCNGRSHTQHSVSVNKNATCVLSKLYEPEHFCLVDSNGNEIQAPFELTPENNVSFGMVLKAGVDFNMEYALTCVEDNGEYTQSPKVIFNIGANGPANPSIETVNLNGAKGYWESTGGGEAYRIEYPESVMK